MTPPKLIENIKNQELNIDEVFASVATFLKECAEDDGVAFLRLLRRDLDTNADYFRMHRIGELGANDETYQEAMLRLFKYVDTNKLDLGAIPNVEAYD